VQVITGLNQPEDIYVDAMNIYWTDIGDNTVWQADKFSFEKVQLADHQSKPWRVVTDGQKVYWTSNLGGGVLSTPIGGGTVELVYPANRPTGIAVDDSSIFWSNDGTAQIYKAPKLPGTGAPFLGHTADELYVDATRIYGRSLVPDSTTVPDSAFGVDKTTAAAIYYDQTLVPGLTVDSNRVYWYRATERYLSSALKNGTDRITQHFAAPPISFMKADDCHLFFVEPPHRIWNLPHASDRSSKLNVVTAAGTAIRRLAIDDRYVYWTDAGGGFIGRVAR